MSAALLPQLDISTYGSQIFWLVITFSILYFSLSKIFLPNIINLVKKREHYIEGIYQDIDVENGKIRELEEEKLSIINKTKSDAGDIIKSAKSKVDSIHNDARTLTEKKLSAMQDALEADLKKDIEGDKNYYKKNSIEIFKNFTDIFSLTGDLNQNLELIFEKNWSKKTNEITNKYNKG